MTDNQHTGFSARSQQNETFFSVRMIGITGQPCISVTKNRFGFLKTDPVFLLIDPIFAVIPFKTKFAHI
jgi:hypothetical protein